MTSNSTTDQPTERWSADELIPFGKYVLLSRICSGGTSAVYRAKIPGEAGFERLVALKRLLPHMSGDPEFVNAFVREAKTVSQLSHTHICPVYELGRVGESLYMAMEHIAGKDLGRLMQAFAARSRSMPPVVAAWIAARLCEALDYAHHLRDAGGDEAGLIHRDLSPANVLLSYEGHVKLIDFGLAKAVGRAQQTNVAALKKKLGYMSPEMVLGRPVDHRSDIFGIGALLFEMLTNQKPFAGSDDITTLQLVSQGAVQPPSVLAPDVPATLDEIVLRALQPEPDARFATAADMAEALETFVVSQDPRFGARQAKAVMDDLFGALRVQEQAELKQLMAASADPEIMAARHRFFSQASGAAAVARAEVARRAGSDAPAPPERARDSRPVLRTSDSQPAPIMPAPTATSPSYQSQPEWTHGFDEEATEIFAGEEPAVGLPALVAEVVAGANGSGQTAPTPPAATVGRQQLGANGPPSPTLGPPPPTASLPTSVTGTIPPGPSPQPPRFRRGTRHRSTTVYDGSRDINMRNERLANYMLVAGVFLLSLSIVGLVLRTPLGETLGLRPKPHGAIEVRTTPDLGAAVKLDDVYRGQAPLRLDEVPVGSHTVTVEATGFEPVSRRLAVARGRTSKFEVDMSGDASPASPSQP